MYLNLIGVLLILFVGDGSGNVFEKGRRREKWVRSLQTTVMKNLTKASKCLASSGKNFSSKSN